MTKYFFLILTGMISSCNSIQKMNDDMLYSSETFSVYKDKVLQGKNSAIVHSANHITSNYRSPASEHFSRLITFKFSINEKDNELPVGADHQVIIRDEKESPIIVFGEMPVNISEKPSTFLPPNYSYTFRVDMSPVIHQFEEKGYFETYNGNRIAKSDFKGFYIAGNADPLSWDFVGLQGKGLKLLDSGKDNIYTITVLLNPYNENQIDEKAWKKSINTSDKAQYTSDQPIVDVLYNLSLEEAKKNIEADSTFRTGAKWDGVWTRDISYSILLAFAYNEPEVAKISLLKKVKRDRIIQDTGSGGAWPISSDRTTWALAAWEIYKVTGDMEWLKKAYEIIKNSLADDAKTLGTDTGLYRGESSFLDWREQTYPKWMSNMDIFVSQNLGTNVVHFQAHHILSEMAKILNEPHDHLILTAERIKKGINTKLWMPEKGYYGQYIYGRKDLVLSERFETLGEALAVLFNVADTEMSKSIISKSPITEFGTTCIYPQIPGIPPYHNNGIWPFVQSYWNLASAKAGNEKALTHGLASLYRAGALFLTNYENFVAETGDFKGTEINSDRMLWSIAGNIAMVHRVFIGMSFESNGIRFSPVIPKVYGGIKNLKNFIYRDAVLDIKVVGFGQKIVRISMDGKPLNNTFLGADIEGHHSIEIIMDNQPFDSQDVNLVENQFSLPNPITRLEGHRLVWEVVQNAKEYQIYKNGDKILKTKNLSFDVDGLEAAEYSVSAMDHRGVESFVSEPVLANGYEHTFIFQLEGFAEKSPLLHSNFSGNGFIEISNDKNRKISLRIPSNAGGKYLLDFRYSNGSGPWNTDNKCAIRSLYTNEKYSGSLVFPQRGTNEWSEWGWSNAISIELNKGQNYLELRFEPWNINMNVNVNAALLDYIRIIKIN